MSKVEYYKNILKEAMEKNETKKISNKEFSLDLIKQLKDKGYTTRPMQAGKNNVVYVIANGSASRVDTLRAIADQFHGTYDPHFTTYSTLGAVRFVNGPTSGRGNMCYIVVKEDKKIGESLKDDVREVSVCVALAALVEGCRDDYQIAEFIDKLPDAKIDRLVIDGRTRLVDVRSWMLENQASFRNSVDGAKALLTKFGADKLKRYKIHHKSEQVDTIRKIGSRLAELRGSGSADKWNPSDFYLIRDGVDVTSHSETLAEYNSFVGDPQYIIGVSHKKEEGEANHGKAAVDEMLRRLGGTPYTKTFTKFDNQYTAELIRNIKRIKQGGSDKIVFLVPQESQNVSDTVNANLNRESISANYMKSIPYIIDMIADFNTNEKLDSLVELAYRYAKSEMTFSCNHYKLMGSKLVHITNQKEYDIKLQKLYIPLYKETQATFLVSVNGSPARIQCRSFDSKPQFEVKAKHGYIAKNYKELKLVDIDQNFLK